MSHSEICPVCNGAGKIRQYLDYVCTTNCYSETTCHGCLGKGWVTVEDNIKEGTVYYEQM